MKSMPAATAPSRRPRPPQTTPQVPSKVLPAQRCSPMPAASAAPAPTPAPRDYASGALQGASGTGEVDARRYGAGTDPGPSEHASGKPKVRSPAP